MKIRDDNGIHRGIPPQARPVKASQPDSRTQTSSAGDAAGDRVELSDRARALHVAKEALSRLPEVRQDRVEAIRRTVKAGAYQVPGEKIAERMLGEGLFG